MVSRFQKKNLDLLIAFSIIAAVMLFMLPSVAAALPDDKEISDAVEDELRMDMAVPAYRIDVKTFEGVVTLSGTVNNILAKERATAIAETVKGVRSVVNTIHVEPSQVRSDGAIEADVKNALLYDPATDSYEVEVAVKDNVVTLTGNVDSFREKELCATVAKSVRDVMDLKNNIRVNYNETRPESEIRTDIERALHWDTFVDDGMIEVSVDADEVKLSGTVGSAAEKSRAISLSYVAGVRTVSGDGLTVSYWVRNPDLRQEKYTRKTDAQIRDAVRDAMLYDLRVVSFKIDVDVDNRVVTLRGTVDNLKAKRAAEMDARNTVGVFYVKNRIKVRPEKSENNAALKDRVEAALLRDPYIESYDVSVEVRNGIVDLYGTVDSYFDKAQADDVASRVNGVIAVDNNLAVSDIYKPYAYNPYLDDWRIGNYPWYTYKTGSTTKSDMEIKEDIESELFWSPFIDSDQVAVSVENGEAELTGTVDSWSEFYAASENAFEGGAVEVDNDLIVR